MKSEKEWYSSKEHFLTEESYDQYKARKKKQRTTLKKSPIGLFGKFR